MTDITIFVALLAGLVSFLSPCVLPIIPGFLGYLAGTSGESGESTKGDRWLIFKASIFFVLGFSVIFSILGVLLNSVLANVAYDTQIWLGRIGGAVIIFFGLFLTGLIKPKFLQADRRIQVKRKFSSKNLTSFVFGAAFAVGWTPCVGAVLGAVIGLAASQPGSALSLFLAYSIGLGIPFLLIGFFASYAERAIARYSKYIKYINIVFGIILIAIGVLVFTNSLNLVANFGFVNRFVL